MPRAKKPLPKIVGGNYFSSVRKAREALRERAFELLDGYIAVIKQAAAAGDYETAAKGYQHLLEHMPPEDGMRMIELSVDKPVQVERKPGPSINIGFAIGGIPQTQHPRLQPATIDIISADE